MMTLAQREMELKNIIMERSLGASFHVFARVLEQNYDIYKEETNLLKFSYKFLKNDLDPINLIMFRFTNV